MQLTKLVKILVGVGALVLVLVALGMEGIKPKQELAQTIKEKMPAVEQEVQKKMANDNNNNDLHALARQQQEVKKEEKDPLWFEKQQVYQTCFSMSYSGKDTVLAQEWGEVCASEYGHYLKMLTNKYSGEDLRHRQNVAYEVFMRMAFNYTHHKHERSIDEFKQHIRLYADKDLQLDDLVLAKVFVWHFYQCLGRSDHSSPMWELNGDFKAIQACVQKFGNQSKSKSKSM